MIKIERKGSLVKVEVEAAVPNYSTRLWSLYWDASSEWAAGLLTQLFKDALWNRLKSIREKSYERGWADARAKKRGKDTYFTGSINDI